MAFPSFIQAESRNFPSPLESLAVQNILCPQIFGVQAMKTVEELGTCTSVVTASEGTVLGLICSNSGMQFTSM